MTTGNGTVYMTVPGKKERKLALPEQKALAAAVAAQDPREGSAPWHLLNGIRRRNGM